jgi:hypothetical protein
MHTVAIATFSLALSSNLLASDATISQDIARASIVASIANDDSFSRLTCRYTAIYGKAKSIEDARAGRLYERNEEAEFLWVVDGKRMSISCCVVDMGKSKKNEKLTPLPGAPGLLVGGARRFNHEKSISNDHLTALHYPTENNVNIRKINSGRLHGRTLFGCFGERCDDKIRSLLRDLGQHVATAEVTEESENSMQLLRIAANYADGRESIRGRHEYWLAPTRGFIAVRYHREHQDQLQNTFHTERSDFRDCQNGRWIAGRVLSMDRQKQTDWRVTDFRITSLEVDRPPNPEHFVLDLPAGTAVLDFDTDYSTFRTRKAERVGPDDLDRLYDMTKQTVSARRQKRPMPPMDTTIKPTPSPYRWLWWAGGGVAVVLLAVIGWRIRRRRAA